MFRLQRLRLVRTCMLAGLPLITGCGESGPPAPTTAEVTPVDPAAATPASPAEATGVSPVALPSISLGGSASTTTPALGERPTEVQRRRELIDAMSPLQVMLGSWKGTTQREFGDFKALDEPEWVWDFQTDPQQPAMVMTSAASPYFREMRLTYLTHEDQYRLRITAGDHNSRSLAGTFSHPVEEFQGDDKRLHRRYKLELTEVDPAGERDAWQIVLNQQENDRYLVELSRKRGARFMRFDTVATQRQGTSFALNDEDYGEKACIITGGLGTSTVSFQGKTYWVCCSGCRAAFEEDPAKWIAAAANLNRQED